MTESKFFALLADCAKERPFKLCTSGQVRQRGTNFCPVLAVAKKVTGNRYRLPNFGEAGKAAGLAYYFTTDIAEASDLPRSATAKLAALRDKVLRSV